MLLAFLQKLVRVGKKLETKLQYFDRYFHNKCILEYAQILATDGMFIVFDIEGHSTV